MKIVVLDGFAMNPGDLDWGSLGSLGSCEIYDRTPAELVVDRARDAQIALTNKTILDAQTLAQLPRLRYIGVLATGYNVVDIEAAKRAGIIVTNVPAYSTASVAQMTFALLLELCHHVGDHSRGVRQGKWTASRDFCYWDYPLVELEGLTLGVVGLGQIGQAVCRLGQCFGMKVIANSRSVKDVPGVELTSLDDLLGRSDVVSLHCPLSEQTRCMIDSRTLARMKPTSMLINTGRGGLINERDLADALNAGRLAGAAVDVLSSEPPSADNPLLSAANCIITPHIAWATAASRQRLMNTAVENVRAFMVGSPVNVVN